MPAVQVQFVEIRRVVPLADEQVLLHGPAMLDVDLFEEIAHALLREAQLLQVQGARRIVNNAIGAGDAVEGVRGEIVDAEALLQLVGPPPTAQRPLSPRARGVTAAEPAAKGLLAVRAIAVLE